MLNLALKYHAFSVGYSVWCYCVYLIKCIDFQGNVKDVLSERFVVLLTGSTCDW